MEDTLIDFGLPIQEKKLPVSMQGEDTLIDWSVPTPKLSTQRIAALKAQPAVKDKLLDFTGFWGNVGETFANVGDVFINRRPSIPEPTPEQLARIPGGYKPIVKPEAMAGYPSEQPKPVVKAFGEGVFDAVKTGLGKEAWQRALMLKPITEPVLDYLDLDFRANFADPKINDLKPLTSEEAKRYSAGQIVGTVAILAELVREGLPSVKYFIDTLKYNKGFNKSITPEQVFEVGKKFIRREPLTPHERGIYDQVQARVDIAEYIKQQVASAEGVNLPALPSAGISPAVGVAPQVAPQAAGIVPKLPPQPVTPAGVPTRIPIPPAQVAPQPTITPKVVSEPVQQIYRVAFDIDGKVYEGKPGEIHSQLLNRLPQKTQDRYYKLLADPDSAGFLSGFVDKSGEFQTRGDIEMRTGEVPNVEVVNKDFVRVSPPQPAEIKPISKELELLAVEARKYKTAEEFKDYFLKSLPTSKVAEAWEKAYPDKEFSAQSIWVKAHNIEPQFYKNANKTVTELKLNMLQPEDKQIISSFMDYVHKKYPDTRWDLSVGEQPISIVGRIGKPSEIPAEDWLPYDYRIMPIIKTFIQTYGSKSVSAGYDIFHELAHKIGIKDEIKADNFAIKNLTDFFTQTTKPAGVKPLAKEFNVGDRVDYTNDLGKTRKLTVIAKDENSYKLSQKRDVKKEDIATTGIWVSKAELATQATKPVAKEPWEMTFEQWKSEHPDNRSAIFEDNQFHHDLVKSKLKEGAIIPPEVLKDYPDLAGKVEPKKVSFGEFVRQKVGANPNLKNSWYVGNMPLKKYEGTGAIRINKKAFANLESEFEKLGGSIIEARPATLDAAISANAEAVSKNVTRQKQAGFVRSPLPERTPEISHPEKVRKVLEVTRTPANVIQEGIREVGKIKEGIRKTFVFKENVIGHPEYRNDVRKFIDSPVDARNKSERAIFGIVGDLDRAEYKKFRHIVALADLVETASEGKSIPRGITLPEVQASLETEMAAATPAIKNAVNKHFELMGLVGKDLVDRGKLSEEQVRANYYPHKVLDYEPDWGDWVGLGQKMRKPYRPYTRERVGSVRDIDMDYVRVLDNHLTKVFLDNSTDDFIATQMAKNDIMPKLSPEQKIKVFGVEGKPTPGKLYTIDGKEYRSFQAEPGNAIYPASTINERLFNMAVENNLTAEEFSKMTGKRGGVAMRQAGVLGQPHKVYVLPRAIAEDLLRFKTPAGDLGLFYPLMHLTGMWKRFTLDFAGLPFQLNNFFGDAINLWKTDPAAFSKVPEAILMTVKNPKRLSQIQRDMLGLAKEQRVTMTFFLQEMGITPEGKLLKRFDDPLHRFNPISVIANIMETVSTKRETILRLGKFMKDMERIQAGKNVVAGEVDVKGLPQIDQAGKVARVALVDYGAVTGAYKRVMRGLLTPFITFYDYNARNWVRYAATKPMDMAWKFLVPLAAMWLWNNTGERKQIEENLPEWMKFMPHINTGYIGKDNKPIVIALQTPIDMATSWFGIDKIPAKITSIRAGDMTVEEAAMAQLKDTVLAPVQTVGHLLNPMIQAVQGRLTNKDPFTGYTIIPERVKGTSDEKKLWAQFTTQKLIAPYGQYLKATRMIEPGDLFSKWLLGGPFDLKRALGIREVDLERGKSERYRGKEALLKARLNTILLRIEQGWEEYSVSGKRERLDKAIVDMAKSDVKPTEEQIANRLMNWNMTERILKGKIRLSKPDSPEYKEMKESLKFINDNRDLLMFKQTPTAIRSQLAEEFMRIKGQRQ